MNQQERQEDRERGAIKYSFVLYFQTLGGAAAKKKIRSSLKNICVRLHGAAEEHIQSWPAVKLEEFGSIPKGELHEPGVDGVVRLRGVL